MLIQLAVCHPNPPSHIHPLSPSGSPTHLCMQAVSLELRKSSFDSLWAVLIRSRVMRIYSPPLSLHPPSIHPSGRLTDSSLTFCVMHWAWFNSKGWVELFGTKVTPNARYFCSGAWELSSRVSGRLTPQDVLEQVRDANISRKRVEFLTPGQCWTTFSLCYCKSWSWQTKNWTHTHKLSYIYC